MRHFREIKEIRETHETAMRQIDAANHFTDHQTMVIEVDLLYEIGAKMICAIEELATAHCVTADVVTEKLRLKEKREHELRRLKNAATTMKTHYGVNAEGIDNVVHAINAELLDKKSIIGRKI